MTTTSRASSGRRAWLSIGRRKPSRSGCSSSKSSSSDGRRSLPRRKPRSMTRWTIGSSAQRWPACAGSYPSNRAGSVTRSSMSIRRWARSSMLLLPPPPFSEARQQEIVARVKQIPATLQAAQENLTDLRQPFVQLAIDCPGSGRRALRTDGEGARTAAHRSQQPGAATSDAGRGNSAHAISRVARQPNCPPLAKTRPSDATTTSFSCAMWRCCPYTPEQLLAMSQQEWSRAVAFEAYQQARLAGAPPAPFFPNADGTDTSRKGR